MKEALPCQFTMSRYFELLELAEDLWQKERAQRVVVEGVRK
jgi:hypothetical protein